MTTAAIPAVEVAEAWERWCGDTTWTRAMYEWAKLGGKVIWWGGMPRSASAIPLCFILVDTTGREMPGRSRLKDIRAAVAAEKETR